MTEPTEITDAEWRYFQAIPEQGYSHRGWVDARIRERVENLERQLEEAEKRRQRDVQFLLDQRAELRTEWGIEYEGLGMTMNGPPIVTQTVHSEAEAYTAQKFTHGSWKNRVVKVVKRRVSEWEKA